MTVILISIVFGFISGACLTCLTIWFAVKISAGIEDRERNFALKVTNIEADAVPLEQEWTGEEDKIIEQENTGEDKGIGDIPPANRSDILGG